MNANEMAQKFSREFGIPAAMIAQVEYFIGEMDKCTLTELRAMQAQIKNPIAKKICRFLLSERSATIAALGSR